MSYLVLSLHHFDPGVHGFNPVAGIFPPAVQLYRDGLGIGTTPTGGRQYGSAHRSVYWDNCM